ncbi:hypothetical protein PISMIDRAFT_98520, partial [Pisolithus microcarpus 441]
HPDIDFFQLHLGSSGDHACNLMQLISAPSQQQWDIHKTETGITKPPLILSLDPSHLLGVPLCMTVGVIQLVCCSIATTLHKCIVCTYSFCSTVVFT